MEDIPSALNVIRKERSDDQGNELWFPMMIRYLEESPYGKKHGLTGLDGLLWHLEKRKALEHRIMEEVFGENAVVSAIILTDDNVRCGRTIQRCLGAGEM